MASLVNWKVNVAVFCTAIHDSYF